MSLRRLRHALALAECASFAKAAEVVHLSQPAFSRSIQSLETELGVVLFDRDRRGAILTPVGRVVIERVRKMVYEERGMRRDIALMRTAELGNVCIGLGPIPVAVFAPPLLTEMSISYPKINIRIEIGNWQALISLFEQERLDVGIMDIREIRSHKNVVVEELPFHRLVFFCHSGHPLAKRNSVMPSDILEYPLASVHHPPSAIEEFCRDLRFDGQPAEMFRVECDNLLVLEGLATTSDTIILAPRMSFRHAPGVNELVQLDLSNFDHVTHYGLVKPIGRVLSPPAEALISIIRSICERPA